VHSAAARPVSSTRTLVSSKRPVINAQIATAAARQRPAVSASAPRHASDR
jgi:hypothetical protein